MITIQLQLEQNHQNQYENSREQRGRRPFHQEHQDEWHHPIRNQGVVDGEAGEARILFGALPLSMMTMTMKTVYRMMKM
jgi:hypothetical protein